MRELDVCSADGCDRPVAREGTYLCAECSARLAELMREVPWMCRQLFITAAKLDHVRSATSPESSGGAPGSAMPIRDLAPLDKRRALMLFEVSSVQAIVTDKFASGILDHLEQLMVEGLQLIDQPTSKVVWGACDRPVEVECELEDGSVGTVTQACGTLVVAPDDSRVTICRGCGGLLSKDKFEQDQFSRAWGWDVAPPLPPREVSQFLAETLRVRVTIKDIENWNKRGHLRGILMHVPSDQKRPRKVYFPREVLATHQRFEGTGRR